MRPAGFQHVGDCINGTIEDGARLITAPFRLVGWLLMLALKIVVVLFVLTAGLAFYAEYQRNQENVAAEETTGHLPDRVQGQEVHGRNAGQE
jgi:hypothetical protein